MAKKKKKSIVAEEQIAHKNSGKKYSQDFEIFMSPYIELGTTAYENMRVWNNNGGTVRKIIVNGEETLINNRQDDPNP